MEDGLAFSGARAIAGVEALAELRGSVGAGAMGRVWGRVWGRAAGGTHADGDPGSDGRMVQRVRALHHGTALGRITQTERGGRARHLEYITEGTHTHTHIWSRDLHIMEKNKTRLGEYRHAERKFKERGNPQKVKQKTNTSAGRA